MVRSSLNPSRALPVPPVAVTPEAAFLQWIQQLFSSLPVSFAIRFWDGATVRVGRDSPAGELPFTLVLRRPAVLSELLLGRDALRLAQGYFHGDIDIEGDLFAALALRDHLEALNLPLKKRLRAAGRLLRLGLRREGFSGGLTAAPQHSRWNSRADNRKAIEFHYDVSNDFYALWLDRSMVYSCAYFEENDADLDRAQWAKLDHICRKLLLQPGESFLDIGCGWGALLLHAARHYGVRAHGITLSSRQFALAQERIADAGLADRVTVALCDYRDLPDVPYDKVASVGMFEHVGLKNLPVYFATAHRVLKPGGLFLNHGITHDREGWERNVFTEFINRYVFPDAELDTVSNVQRAMESGRFEILDVEALRPHYALTLRHWVERLERHHSQALRYVTEATYRVWRLYMAACALEFESGGIGVYQILASRRTRGAVALPRTRRHLYAPRSLEPSRAGR